MVPKVFFLPKDLLQTSNKGILSGEVFLYCQPWAKAKSVVETRSEVDPEICLFTSNWQSWRHVNIHLTSWGSSSTCRAWKIKIKINKIKMTIADQWSLTSDHRAEPKVTKWSQCVSMCLAKNQPFGYHRFSTFSERVTTLYWTSNFLWSQSSQWVVKG